METLTSILYSMSYIMWICVAAFIIYLFLPPRYDPVIRFREWLEDDKGSADD